MVTAVDLADLIQHIVSAAKRRRATAAWLALTLTACAGVSAPTPFPTPVVLTTRQATASPTQAPSRTPTGAATGTPDPYAGLSIDHLTTREYGGGQLVFEPEPPGNSFDRYLFHYPSDDLTIYGFMNVPRLEGPRPVVLVLHGYLEPDEYELLPYTTRYADALAAAGFVVLHPNFRNYPPSDPGPSLFRVGYAVDVLNLIALLQEQAGRPGPLANADGQRIALFGHSMGGGIALRLMTVGAPVRAAVLYSSMNADERLNFESIYQWSEGRRGVEELQVPDEALLRISPVYYLDRIGVPVSIHHGEQDELVPPEWSDELCRRLRFLGKTVECYRYPNELHTFIGFGGIELIDRTVTFFEEHMGEP